MKTAHLILRAILTFLLGLGTPLVAAPFTLVSPQDHQVIQRTSKDEGTIVIRGEFADPTMQAVVVEARVVLDGKPGDGTPGRWKQLPAKPAKGGFQGRLDAPAGGWHRLEVRILEGAKVVAESAVEHVGVGEVFVVAGQSNSGNHGAERQKTKTGLVAAYDGQRWRIANDPQPGASGDGGSFMPPFGDGIAEKFHVPVGIIACGVGATSVREWLPKGARFPNPPTIQTHVTQLDNGEWYSKGTIYAAFVARMKQLGLGGFRAVLWHQGESDANQKDPARTLSGPLYREYLSKVIRDSRRENGWEAPWFVAQVSYHVPGDEASPEIRAAQASLWKEGIALEGPDTDALKGQLRDNGGQGVHFSGPGLREHAARWVQKVSPWLEKQLAAVGAPGSLPSSAAGAARPLSIFTQGARVLFQGDSITDGNRGRSADPNHILGHGYVFILAAKHGAAFPELKHDFMNRGISGNTVLELERRWQQDTLDLKPDVLSVLIGVNDLGRNISLDQYEQVYDKLISAAKASNPNLKLVLCEPFGLPVGPKKANWAAWSDGLKKRQEVVARLAEKHHAALVRFQRAFDEAALRAPAEHWIWDGVHPTYSGHQVMADAWERAVRAFWPETGQ